MDATSKYQEALPLALLAHAPGLCATHVTRYRRTEASMSARDFCPKCGSYAFEGSCTIRVSRSRSQAGEHNTSRSILKTCGTCEWEDALAIDRSNAPAFPRRKNGRRIATPQKDVPSRPKMDAAPFVSLRKDAITRLPDVPPAQTKSVASNTSVPPSTSRPRPRKKKSSALQEMLARNKQTQPPESGSSSQGRLAAFLSDL
ncbi:hypothetical protein BD626DRAFT_479774 [Schizophyllum amplum]|uniref:Uncharacterized protein n=1 Tax=Schizophyllum amplum TaxID=97359 RepID=A0A550CSJ8_9AGAR|nr:hypothetical protein BD626DRAFT_479774 [Auriculariopsis ampla]